MPQTFTSGLLFCLTLIKEAGAPLTSSSLTRPIVEGEGIRWWIWYRGPAPFPNQAEEQGRIEVMGLLTLYTGADILFECTCAEDSIASCRESF